ncbi:MAG: NUDIX domain-containing protein, partial [Tidjanibacter sp.]|nr:NUDIX domain-containing protein [Tidjanibacter sp.]
RFGGEFPAEPDALRSLPGVGDYTAAAVASMAFGLPYAVLDGNVFRVLARLFDVEVPVDTGAGRRIFVELAQSLLDTERPGTYNQALMDFGALLCTPAQPRCGECPLAGCCLALAAGTVALRPVKQGRTKVRERWFHYLHISCEGRTLLCRREGRDIWQGLYEFPLLETEGPADFPALAARSDFRELLGDAEWRLVGTVVMPRHQLSHQTIHATVYRIETPSLSAAAAALAVDTAAVGDYAVPRLLERYLLEYDG